MSTNDTIQITNTTIATMCKRGKGMLLLIPYMICVVTLCHAQQLPQITKDIIYTTIDGKSLTLNMAIPLSGNGPFPAVLHFHGGGWQAGDKSHGDARIVKLAQAGYVAVTVGYRFAPTYKWPDQVFDAKAAVRFLREHAKAYNIDPNRIAAVGDSAGGYLALLLGLTDESDHLEGYSANKTSSHVQAVVTFCSAGDFTRSGKRKLSRELEKQVTEYYGKPLSQVLYEFTGTTNPDDPKLAKMSATAFVDRDDPQVMIFQGELDPLISMEQVEELQRALKKADVHTELIVVKGEKHGWYGAALDTSEKQMIEFLDKILPESNSH